MSTEPETTEDDTPGTPDPAEDTAEAGGGPRAGAAPEAEAGGTTGAAADGGETGADEGAASGGGGAAGTDEGAAGSDEDAAGTDEGAAGTDEDAAGTDEDAAGDGEGVSGAGAQAAGAGRGEAGAEGAGPLSEAEAELAAQRLERERIERRKAAKKGPIESGGKLSGRAADLLAAVRAVESGEKPVTGVFAEPGPAPRRPAPEPARRPRPDAAGRAAPAAPPPPSAQAVAAVRRVLADGGAPETLAPQVAAVLGEGAAERLRADPWHLLRVTGVRPEQADGFARALLGAGCGPDDERRLRAVTGWLLEQAALAGHTALEAPALTAALGRRGVPDPDAALRTAIEHGDVLVFQDTPNASDTPNVSGAPNAPAEAAGDGAQEAEGAERPVRVLVGLERYALAEESLADGLLRIVNSVPKQEGSTEGWERAAGAVRGSAAELIRAVAGHGLVLHTGGAASLAEPAALLHAAAGLGLRAWAAAHSPLGRDGFAALLRRDADAAAGGAADGAPVPHRPGAATVAGLLSGAEGPGRDADGTLDLDLLVVLDAPQLDVETAALLVESLPDGARLVLAGDPAVLWSVGAGRVFADLLQARVCPQVASRTPDPGPLGELVSGIGIGELAQVEAPGKEVVIVPVRDAGEAVHRTVQLVADSVPRAIGVPAEQTVVITPGHGGAAGTRALNAALKERLNPGPGRFGGFDPGDRVVHSPAPGRVLPGHVVTADAEGLHLSCSGTPVVVPRERVEQCVRHGWALTAHQAVGARWPAVVVVLPGDAVQALSRPWVYTAFSRAVRHLSVVHGVEQALPRAVAEVPARPRTTRLPLLLAQAPAAA
ncbi:helix-hairpin-helix domain-containing protein [Streptomyces echinoruber]|uniref:helix-hairpin-helix domain-containing protein n=1 Tax=Streptomyces echinoruber TaxID=68898 RepID=UPI003616CD7A